MFIYTIVMQGIYFRVGSCYRYGLRAEVWSWHFSSTLQSARLKVASILSSILTEILLAKTYWTSTLPRSTSCITVLKKKRFSLSFFRRTAVFNPLTVEQILGHAFGKKIFSGLTNQIGSNRTRLDYKVETTSPKTSDNFILRYRIADFGRTAGVH